MRAIIIEEDRFTEVLELLRAEATQTAKNSLLRHGIDSTGAKLTDAQITTIADEMFRTMNLHFVRWAQSHGARCVR